MKVPGTLLASAIFAVSLSGQGAETTQDLVTAGPGAGDTVSVVKHARYPGLRQSVPAVLPAPDTGLTIALNTGSGLANIPVELSALRCECVRTGANEDSRFACFEFEIRAKAGPPFAWSCWAPDFPNPHRFQVLSTPSRDTYACYVGAGVHLFRITQARDPETMRKDFWNTAQHPDALPVLSGALLFQIVGREHMLGFGPTTWNVVIDSLGESGRDPVVTLHGDNIWPKYTFGLRGGQWELLSKHDNP